MRCYLLCPIQVQKNCVIMQEVSELVAWIKENPSCPMSGPIHYRPLSAGARKQAVLQLYILTVPTT
ncbi:uncharacterized protein BO96DRAFT_352802 [Aspergillus niger CBS 101883]|uniref:uncharacterized protein n=1 Tax=Aspergillus lacticoffeatus (strain CBS 101883) TaxID=1450533 RepID=UPI000D800753|nr:uncharacterized protein BO96DRAFT_352802 [Aspergillus niger CBS 101883]PYH50337.1 hypothetical protein BO96DRAFT_352802 [Aspergillus niger CBS 101883]